MKLAGIKHHFKKTGNLILFLLVVSISIKAQDVTKTTKFPQQVGDITFDPKTDRANFELCGNGFINQYYGLKTTYQGGTKAIKKHLTSNYKYKTAYKNITGYVTIRFVVNCKGQTDRFRVFQLDENYQKVKYDISFISHLTALCKSLNKWIPGKYNNQVYDTYYYLNLKMVKGQIKEITP
ncbi:hypothetical protein [Mucilaginibacter aquariorum]|uniref:TonB C-terminal domain-containing protein n=1 Tax=Mucilaginibacter aquariorum TaxID=2967225 RepID=A0ABT1T621_9SPHI|nr:hypothetical protein [Mucilaginibacter aquariorum]MCQ6960078.1 hypothetical protein [Mucilaginibacter aquariorum]